MRFSTFIGTICLVLSSSANSMCEICVTVLICQQVKQPIKVAGFETLFYRRCTALHIKNCHLIKVKLCGLTIEFHTFYVKTSGPDHWADVWMSYIITILLLKKHKVWCLNMYICTTFNDLLVTSSRLCLFDFCECDFFQLLHSLGYLHNYWIVLKAQWVFDCF